MDSLSIHKIQAINKYRKQQFLSNLLLYTLTTMSCSLLVFSPFWYPPLRIIVNVFLFVSLPKAISLFFSAKFVFILGNLIIVFLVGEFKKYKVPHSLEVHGATVQIPPSSNKERENSKFTLEEKGQNTKMKLQCRHLAKETTRTKVDRCEPQKEEARHLGAQNCQMISIALKPKDTNKVTHIYEETSIEGCWEQKEGNGTKSDGEELKPHEKDLNKMADEFIARVNKQRRLEAELYSII
ncbi:hypothetical protein POM88_044056 [Heracleum sosnowskyi]|uniref:DUF4408 domain-containing protein n=1 Tax=Heracleum sosnowskyi TaxID=360622 RepID=A0AAD8M4W5_9APIA|nr:hypothetical protein POM88_044056 [Heracleum sosnowskyi]